MYVYAILGDAPTAPLGSGLAGEPLTLLAAGDVVAAVGAMDEPPAVSRAAVLGHDAVVRRLSDVSAAILPTRFGMIDDASALTDWLRTAADALGEALHLVAGREQMTLHVFDGADPSAVDADEPADEASDARASGPGTRYLTLRRRERRREEGVPELAPLRARLAALVVAERTERRATPPFRASVYHLIERGRSAEYRAAVDDGRELAHGVRLRVSGPWAPYAFAPDPLS